ncbi:MAG: dethiobiotin synthase [Planctomycetota bacterium]|nr:dethiobiotin synthase [Planctomycetota bacterium]
MIRREIREARIPNAEAAQFRGVFITGTDTGVGKTVVAAGIARALKSRGLNVGVMKPVATGAIRQGKRLVNPDVLFLRDAIGLRDPLGLINPVCLMYPLAPAVAARLGRQRIDLARIAAAFVKLRRMHDVLVVEGIGGLLVPIKSGYFVVDMAREFGLPLLVVARPTLGTINHVALTLECARSRGLDIAGVVLNYHADFPRGLAEKTNRKTIEEYCGARFLGETVFYEGVSPENIPTAQFVHIADALCRGI